jgi:hypothetical protein
MNIRLKGWLNQRLPACDDVTQLVSDSLVRRLSLREWLKVRLHFFMCIYCKLFYEQVRLLRTLLAKHLTAAVPLPDDVKERLKRLLAESRRDDA